MGRRRENAHEIDFREEEEGERRKRGQQNEGEKDRFRGR